MRPADGDGHMPEAQDTVGYSYRDGIVRIAVDHPPVNALARPVREGLHAALDRAAAEDGAQAVLLVGTARGFPAGEDLAELDAPLSGPSVADLCARIEAFGIPVIAALHGTVMGGGLELALAAHYRIALTSTRVGLPQVRLGLVPGAGATQRVPRMIGARAARSVRLDLGQILTAQERIDLDEIAVRSIVVAFGFRGDLQHGQRRAGDVGVRGARQGVVRVKGEVGVLGADLDLAIVLGEAQNAVVAELTAEQTGARRAIFGVGEIDELVIELIGCDLHVEIAILRIAIKRKQTVDDFKLFREALDGFRFVFALVLGECGRTR